jgi:hypothetical protein
MPLHNNICPFFVPLLWLLAICHNTSIELNIEVKDCENQRWMEVAQDNAHGQTLELPVLSIVQQYVPAI